MSSSRFNRQDRVVYEKGGAKLPATVVGVHTDDPSGAYYTVRFADGRTRETEASRLRRPSPDRVAVPAAMLRAAATRAAAGTDASRRRPSPQRRAAPSGAASSRDARAVNSANSRGTKRRADGAAIDLEAGAAPVVIDLNQTDERMAQALAGVTGLAALVETMYASVGRAALAWCTASDVDDVRQIVAAGQVDAFVQACGVKRGGTKERILRTRLAQLAPD